MILDQIMKLIDKEMTLGNDDKEVDELLDKEYELLINSLDDTIYCINNIPRDYFYFLAENFCDISQYFKSPELIDVMKKNIVKYKDEFALSDLAYAVLALNDNEYTEDDVDKMIISLKKELF